MAYDKVIDSALLEADLTTVADAIRSKGGTSEALSFPNGFVSAVEEIQAGGGVDVEQYRAILTRRAVIFEDNEVTELGNYAFRDCKKLTSITANAATHVHNYVFSYCSGLVTVNLPNVTQAYNNAFEYCSALTEIRLPKLTNPGSYMFSNCAYLQTVELPSIENVAFYMFRSCFRLARFDAHYATSILDNAFGSCSALDTIIIRTGSVCSLASVAAFNSTPFASNGTGGTVYVPSALIESYKTATNWSTLYAAGTCNFVAIEGSEYE